MKGRRRQNSRPMCSFALSETLSHVTTAFLRRLRKHLVHNCGEIFATGIALREPSESTHAGSLPSWSISLESSADKTEPYPRCQGKALSRASLHLHRSRQTRAPWMGQGRKLILAPHSTYGSSLSVIYWTEEKCLKRSAFEQ